MSEGFNAKRREMPTGKGRELSEALREHLMVFQEVKNKVAFVNPAFNYEFTSRSGENKNMNLPFKLEDFKPEEGKESALGLFAKTFVKSYEHEGKRLEVWPIHRRSALLERVILKDREGRFYRDVDLKGIGFVREGLVWRPGDRRGSEDEFYGFLGRDAAFAEHEWTEKFIAKGIRTDRVLSIINLEEIVSDGEKISLNEAMKRGIIKGNLDPVVMVRAFGTKARIHDVLEGLGEDKRLKGILLEDAKKLISQEIGKDLSDNKNYIEWFVETLGKNIGLMHKNGWLHGQLNKHNITLDCRLVDLDDVEEIDKNNEDAESRFLREREIDDAAGCLGDLINTLGLKDEMHIFSKKFYQNYKTAFPETESVRFSK